MVTLGVCLSLLAAGAGSPQPAPVFIETTRFTLAWSHSIEKVRWEEDYAVIPGDKPRAPPLLKPLMARVRGSAAGMEPPESAVLRNGWYEYPQEITRQRSLRVTRSIYTADYDLCTAGRCEPMGKWLPSDGDITLITACTDPAAR